MSFGSSKQSSQPVDMTPQAFKNLQGPFADVLSRMLGMQSQTMQSQTTTTTPTRGSGSSTPGVLFGNLGVGGQGNDEYGYRRFSSYNTPTAPTSTTTYSTPSGPFNPNDMLNGLPKYEGPLTGTMQPNEQALLDKLMQMGTQGAAGPNPLLEQYIAAAQRPGLEGLTETLTRDLPGRFTQAGQMVQPQGSSAFDRAAAIATRGVAQSQQDIATNIGYQAYENSGTRHAQEIDTTIKNLQAQALPRLIQELGIERGIEQFNQRVTALMQTLGITAGVTQPTISNSSTGKSTQIGLK